MLNLTILDMSALLWFIATWFGFSILSDRTALREKSLSHMMAQHRQRWVRTMAKRDNRIMDTAIITGLQNGTAFFASTSLLAIGAGFALLSSTDLALQVSRDLGLPIEQNRGVWEAKVLMLIIIYVYAFFKFGWAYRLFNYTSILMGAFPDPQEVSKTELDRAINQTARINSLAGWHFDLGLRAFFYSLSLFGWFIHPLLFVAATSFVTLVLIRRQYFSRSQALAKEMLD